MRQATAGRKGSRGQRQSRAQGAVGSRLQEGDTGHVTTFLAPPGGSGSTQRKREQRRERNRCVPQRTGAESCEMPTEGTCSWLASSIPGSSTCTAGSPRQRADCIAAAGPCGDSSCSRSHPGGRKVPSGAGDMGHPQGYPSSNLSTSPNRAPGERPSLTRRSDATFKSLLKSNVSLNKARTQEIPFISRESLKTHAPCLPSLNFTRYLFTGVLSRISPS